MGTQRDAECGYRLDEAAGPHCEDPSLTGVAVIGLHFAEASLHSAEPRFAIQDPHIDTYKKLVVTGILRFRFLDFHYLVFLCEDHL